MTLFKFKQRGQPLLNGMWFLNQNADVIVKCPGCGAVGNLSESSHTVSDDGYISPSLACPHCGFHDTVGLEGWIRGTEPPTKERVTT